MRALLLAATAIALMACQTSPTPQTSEAETNAPSATSDAGAPAPTPALPVSRPDDADEETVAATGSDTPTEVAAAPPAPAPEPVRTVVPGGATVEQAGDHLYVDFVQFQPNRLPAGACLSEREVRADQFARLRSNMMVVGLTCRTIFDGDPFNQYMQFTVDTAGSIRSVQQTLAALLGRYGGGNSNRLVDTYVTELANDEQGVIREFGPEAYCNARQDQFARVTTYSDAEVSEWLDGAVERRGDLYPRC